MLARVLKVGIDEKIDLVRCNADLRSGHNWIVDEVNSCTVKGLGLRFVCHTLGCPDQCHLPLYQ